MKIIEIEGIGDKYAKDLEKAGIAEVEDLIPITWSALKELAEKTKISLMVIDGVGPEYSEVLNLVGIDSTKELAYRSPEKTLEKIVAHDKEHPDTIRNMPEVAQIKGWIDEAKKIYNVKKEKTSPKGTPIFEIEGIGKKWGKTLEKAGFSSVENLIGLDRDGIKDLAGKTKISEKLMMILKSRIS